MNATAGRGFPINVCVHERMMQLFELYLVVGGMPAAVSTYLETKNLRRVAGEQNAILGLYRRDISQYDTLDRLYLNEIFDLTPSEPNAKNKRFILKSLNEKARFDKYYDSFLWLKNAGVALPVNVVGKPKVPLLLSKSKNLFTLYSPVFFFCESSNPFDMGKSRKSIYGFDMSCTGFLPAKKPDRIGL